MGRRIANVGGYCLVLAALAGAAGCGARKRAVRMHCMANLKQIGMALQMFAADKEDKYPQTLKELVQGEFAPDGRVFICKARPDRWGYDYVEGLTPDDPAFCVVVCDKAGNHKDGRNVLLNDGSVEWMTEETFQAALKKTIDHAKSAGREAKLREE